MKILNEPHQTTVHFSSNAGCYSILMVITYLIFGFIFLAPSGWLWNSVKTYGEPGMFRDILPYLKFAGLTFILWFAFKWFRENFSTQILILIPGKMLLKKRALFFTKKAEMDYSDIRSIFFLQEETIPMDKKSVKGLPVHPDFTTGSMEIEFKGKIYRIGTTMPSWDQEEIRKLIKSKQAGTSI